MDEEVKSGLCELDKRISTTEKRFEDMRGYLGVVSVIISTVLGIAAWNLNSERSALREYEKEMKTEIMERLGQSAESHVEFFATEGTRLEGQEIVPSIDQDEEGRARLSFKYVMRNTGNGSTGEIWLKLYTRRDLPTFDESIDEREYVFETWLSGDKIRPNNLPGKLALRYSFGFSSPELKPGRHEVLIRAFYGNGNVTSTPFFLVIR